MSAQPTNPKRKWLNIEPPPPKPAGTIFFMMVPIIAAVFGLLGMPDILKALSMPLFTNMHTFFNDGKIDWVEQVSFVPSAFATAIAGKDYWGLFKTMFQASFAQLSPWIWIINGFFIWIFGHIVEKQLKGWRFPVFMLLVIVTGWTAVYIQAGLMQNKEYIGPSMMLFGLLGAYFVFLPKKPFKAQQWVRPNTEIFRNEQKEPFHEKNFVNPWVYVTAFAVYQILLQLALNVGKDWFVDHTHVRQVGDFVQALLGRMQTVPSAFSPVAAIMNIGAGAVIAMALPKLALSLKPKRPGGKMQLEVIQHYRELRNLDMTHEQACEGAARFASVPIDIAKDWISKGSAGLKDQEIH